MTHHPVAVPAARGGVALPVVLATTFVLLLAMAIVHGQHVTGLQLSAHQQHAAVAAEAADAGLDWLLGRLNAGVPVTATCEPDPISTAGPLRDTLAGLPDARGHWSAPPPAVPLGCLRHDTAWACRCPVGTGVGVAPADAAPRAAFAVALQPGPTPDLLRVRSTGCSGWAESCGGPSGHRAHAHAQARAFVDLAHRPALHHPPVAAVTVHGRLDLGSAPWQVDAAGAGGLALRAAGLGPAGQLQLGGPPGAPRSSLMLSGDTSLVLDEPHTPFAAMFHMDPAAWRAQPSVRRIGCATACDTALQSALGAGVHHRMLWFDGGLHLAGRATLGTPERPVLAIADGPVDLGGAVTVHGLLYVRGDTWSTAAPVEVRGAVVAEGPLRAAGPARIRLDPAVLLALRHRTGTFVRVPGSWRDFE